MCDLYFAYTHRAHAHTVHFTLIKTSISTSLSLSLYSAYNIPCLLFILRVFFVEIQSRMVSTNVCASTSESMWLYGIGTFHHMTCIFILYTLTNLIWSDVLCVLDDIRLNIHAHKGKKIFFVLWVLPCKPRKQYSTLIATSRIFKIMSSKINNKNNNATSTISRGINRSSSSVLLPTMRAIVCVCVRDC